MIDLNRLETWLAQSNLKSTNFPLFQVIKFLITGTRELQQETENALNGPGGPVANLASQNFLTWDNNTPTLINSKELLAGSGIIFNDVTYGERTISASAGELPVGTVFSTWIFSNPGGLLGYGTWELFAVGEGSTGTDITFTVQ